MDLIADILLAAGAIGAAVYCVVLSRRLSRLTDLQGGVGGAVATLSAQVDEMTRALDRSRRAAGEQSATLERSTRRAEDAARRLDLLVAAMHDLPSEAPGTARGGARDGAHAEARRAAEAAEAPAGDEGARAAPEGAGSPEAVRGPRPLGGAERMVARTHAAPPVAGPVAGPTVGPARPAPEPKPEPRPAPAAQPNAPTPAPEPTPEPMAEPAADPAASAGDWTDDAAAWDDWDPFEVAEPVDLAPEPAGRAADRAAQTPAPERAIGSRPHGGEAPAAAPERAAPEPASRPTAAPLPIFTAARPAVRPAPVAEGLPAAMVRRLRVGE